MSFLRRVRGVAVTAVMWGTAFAAVGVSVGVVLDTIGLTQPLSVRGLIDVLAIAAVCGAIGAGVATSTLRLARRADESQRPSRRATTPPPTPT